MDDSSDEAYFAPRLCMREPIPDLWDVALLLERAADSHLAGDVGRADLLLREANRPAVREWTESLWGSAKANPAQLRYRRVRTVANSQPRLPKEKRVQVRKPNAEERAAIISHYGRYCVFCRIPLIRFEVRAAFHRLYPDAVPWGSTNPSQHAAFQALWLQFDHLLPHSRGGDNSISNIVVTCAGCNYGRMDNTLDELGLIDPRSRNASCGGWDGLERVLIRQETGTHNLGVPRRTPRPL
jgi:hypothetical protein